jgi:nitroimidazol reductase NimA-like FMN-containing flavoprotein (pyridoxamine 5'-phosphate oxidase superfamily)
MHREMRRKDRQTSTEAAIDIIQRGEYGTLATLGEDNMPYVVPLSYAYVENCIYFHCAKVGHKLDNIKINPKVSFCVVGDTKVIPDQFSTAFKSIIAFGTAEIIQDNVAKIKGLKALIEKYSPDFKVEGDEYINKDFSLTSVVKIHIEHITGKHRDE